jgi:hypothetical protein
VFPTGIDRRDDLGSPDRFDVCEPTAHRLHPNVVLPPPHRRAKVLRQPPVAARSSDG